MATQKGFYVREPKPKRRYYEVFDDIPLDEFLGRSSYNFEWFRNEIKKLGEKQKQEKLKQRFRKYKIKSKFKEDRAKFNNDEEYAKHIVSVYKKYCREQIKAKAQTNEQAEAVLYKNKTISKNKKNPKLQTKYTSKTKFKLEPNFIFKPKKIINPVTISKQNSKFLAKTALKTSLKISNNKGKEKKIMNYENLSDVIIDADGTPRVAERGTNINDMKNFYKVKDLLKNKITNSSEDEFVNEIILDSNLCDDKNSYVEPANSEIYGNEVSCESLMFGTEIIHKILKNNNNMKDKSINVYCKRDQFGTIEDIEIEDNINDFSGWEFLEKWKNLNAETGN